MRKRSDKIAKLVLALMIPCIFSLTSCNEDVVEPTNNMPPKWMIKVPPQKVER
jgi:hypothetical protein